MQKEHLTNMIASFASSIASELIAGSVRALGEDTFLFERSVENCERYVSIGREAWAVTGDDMADDSGLFDPEYRGVVDQRMVGGRDWACLIQFCETKGIQVAYIDMMVKRPGSREVNWFDIARYFVNEGVDVVEANCRNITSGKKMFALIEHMLVKAKIAETDEESHDVAIPLTQKGLDSLKL